MTKRGKDVETKTKKKEERTNRKENYIKREKKENAKNNRVKKRKSKLEKDRKIESKD